MERQITNLTSQINEAWRKLGLDEKIAEKSKLEQEIADPNLWNDPENARIKMAAIRMIAAAANNSKVINRIRYVAPPTRNLMYLSIKEGGVVP